MTNEVIAYPDPSVWKSYEPNFNADDLCVITRQDVGGKYQDTGCGDLLKYICQVY